MAVEEEIADEYRDIAERRDVEGRRHTTPTTCARCGGHHDDLSQVAFWRPILDHEDGFAWRWWAECPVTGDPILIRDAEE